MEIASINGNRITLREAIDAERIRGMSRIALRVGAGGPRRDGVLRIAAVIPTEGVVVTMEDVRSSMPTACVGDVITTPYNDVDDHVDDHACLVAYLLSAVRRKDWHAVSDAANDLRVLEAGRR